MSAKGHKLSYYRQGVNDAFWGATCECGWHFKGVFATKKLPIKNAHEDHVSDVLGIEPEWVRQAKAKENNA